MNLYRILGQEGRITIPWPIREKLGFSYNDILSFTVEGGSVVIRKERLCDYRVGRQDSLDSLLDRLSPEQEQALATTLARRILKRNGGGRCGRS